MPRAFVDWSRQAPDTGGDDTVREYGLQLAGGADPVFLCQFVRKPVIEHPARLVESLHIVEIPVERFKLNRAKNIGGDPWPKAIKDCVCLVAVAWDRAINVFFTVFELCPSPVIRMPAPVTDQHIK